MSGLNGSVTQILNAAERGDAEASARLLPVVYQELRRLAAQKLAHESPGHTLQATALVHEAYVRLVGGESANIPRWDGRRHFFAAAAEAMRRILVESARRKHSQKRGGGMDRKDVDAIEIAAPARSDDLLALDEALNRLGEVDPPAAELVKLRYFAGLSLAEAAKVLDVAPRTADRLWAYARAWLHREVAGSDQGPQAPAAPHPTEPVA
jgi:RNA polymerase sigma factor (TIGR02999 family)